METHLSRYLNKIQLINLAISIFVMQLYRLPLINNMRTWHIRNTDSFSVTHTSVAELYQPFYQFRFAVLFIIDNQNISDILRIHSHFFLSRKIRLISPFLITILNKLQIRFHSHSSTYSYTCDLVLLYKTDMT